MFKDIRMVLLLEEISFIADWDGSRPSQALDELSYRIPPCCKLRSVRVSKNFKGNWVVSAIITSR